jgi:hypothetical protein
VQDGVCCDVYRGKEMTEVLRTMTGLSKRLKLHFSIPFIFG